MKKKYSILLGCLGAALALGALSLMLTAPSWSSSSRFFVSSPAPEKLPLTGAANITLTGGGFSNKTKLWLVPERSIRSATTANLETFGIPQHFVLRDECLYVANGLGAFFIVQGLHSAVPIISGVLDIDGQGLEIALHKDVALIAGGKKGLQIIDIRDKAAPRLLADLPTPSTLSVASSGETAYVACVTNGVEIIDLSDPRHPRRLGKVHNLPTAYKLISGQNLLIIATDTGGLIYDISRPGQPQKLAVLPVGGGIRTVMTRHENILFWATNDLGGHRLYAIDLSRPAIPRILSSTPLNGIPTGISYSDNQIAVALGSSGTQLFSVTDPSLLVPIQNIAPVTRTRFALPIGNDLWVADGGGELLRIDQKKTAALSVNPLTLDFLSQIPPLVTPHLLLFGDTTGVSIYNHREESGPILLARLPITGLKQLYLTGDQRYLWLTTNDGRFSLTGKLIQVDITTPHAPTITNEIPLARPTHIIGDLGTTLVLACHPPRDPKAIITTGGVTYQNSDAEYESLQFIDISPGQTSPLISTYPFAEISRGLSIGNHILTLMQRDGLFRVLDLSDRHKVKELGSLQMPWGYEAGWSGRVTTVIHDNVVFISSNQGKIFVVDLQNLRKPELLGVISVNGPVLSLLANAQFLLADVRTTGLVLIDLIDPRKPTVLGTIPLGGLQHNYAVQGEALWYANNAAQGIWSLPLPRRIPISSAVENRLEASLGQLPQPGAYRFWLTDQQDHLLVPGVTLIDSLEMTK